MEYIAHVRKSDQKVQSVTEHLLDTKELAEGYGSKIRIKHITGLAALLHDLGKFADKFQEYIRLAIKNPEAPPKRGSVDHSTAGGKLLFQLLHVPPQVPLDTQVFFNRALLAEVVGNAIISHHSYLQDFLSHDLSSKVLNRVQDSVIEGYEQSVLIFYQLVMSEDELNEYIEQAIAELDNYLKRDVQEELELKLMFLSKFVFSALVDADRTNTRCFEEVQDKSFRIETNSNQGLFNQYYQQLMVYLESLQIDKKVQKPINLLREEMSLQCEKFAEKPSGMYTLSIPTGGGKTLASLRYALKHALTYDKRQIIYVVPFTTIIEQNAEEVRRILKDNLNILEHHSNVVEESEDADENEREDGLINTRQKLTLAKDNWDSPVIFTTMVQFLNVFFSRGSRSIRRLHNLSQAVIIFDEVQKVPTKCISLFNHALNFLRKYTSSSIVLCTATQPELDFVQNKLEIEPDGEMINNLSDVFDAFKRVEIVDRASKEEYNTEKLTEFVEYKIAEEQSILVILNTKSAVKKLYRRLIEGKKIDKIYHLSTSMCPAHRNFILEKVKRNLNHQEPVVCISTQLIEAGVDISFRCVVRSLAGLDSIAQAAGRCNRHGEYGIKQVYVINHAEEQLKHLKEIKVGKEISRKMFIDMLRDPSAYDGNILSNKAMEIYFRRFYLELAEDLDYFVPSLRKNMTELLFANRSENTYYQTYYTENSKRLPLILANSYKTAADHFQVIDNYNTTVIVPYNKGIELIADLNGEHTIDDVSRILRRAQQYSINISCFEKEILTKNKALIPYLDSKVFALTESAYHGEYGLNLEDDSLLEFLGI